jgi:hypothetical protein
LKSISAEQHTAVGPDLTNGGCKSVNVNTLHGLVSVFALHDDCVLIKSRSMTSEHIYLILPRIVR